MFKTIIESAIVRTAIALVAAYWAAALVLPTAPLIETLNYILIGVAVAVTLAYLPSTLRALRLKRIDRVGQLTLGIVLGWFAIALNRGWSGLIRFTDDTDLAYSPMVGFYVWLAILAGALHITAPGSDEDGVPRRNWLILIGAIAAGCLAAGVMIGVTISVVA